MSEESEIEAEVAKMVIPKVMPTAVDDSSSDDEKDEAAGFLSNTLNLIKEKDNDEVQENSKSAIAADLDSLFSKF